MQILVSQRKMADKILDLHVISVLCAILLMLCKNVTSQNMQNKMASTSTTTTTETRTITMAPIKTFPETKGLPANDPIKGRTLQLFQSNARMDTVVSYSNFTTDMAEGKQKPAVGIEIRWIRSTTSSITIKWRATVRQTDYANLSLAGYKIQYIKDDGLDRLISTQLRAPTDTIMLYDIPDLAMDHNYKVCVQAEARADVNLTDTETFRECIKAYTLPFMHPSSVISLCTILGAVAIIVLAAWLYWKRKKLLEDKKLLDTKVDEKESVALTSETNNTHDDNAASNNGPHVSSIEDPAAYV